YTVSLLLQLWTPHPGKLQSSRRDSEPLQARSSIQNPLNCWLQHDSLTKLMPNCRHATVPSLLSNPSSQTPAQLPLWNTCRMPSVGPPLRNRSAPSSTQSPPKQSSPFAQTFPHAPQLTESTETSVHCTPQRSGSLHSAPSPRSLLRDQSAAVSLSANQMSRTRRSLPVFAGLGALGPFHAAPLGDWACDVPVRTKSNATFMVSLSDTATESVHAMAIPM